MKKFKIPDTSKEYTVTKTIRIKQNLLEKVEEIAYKNNVTINRLIIECIEYSLNNLDINNSNNEEDK